MQALTAGNLDMTVGSILRALVESNAGVALWLEGLIIHVLTLTRASTSVGEDLDTWAADFGLTRLGGVAATGDVTFSRVLTGNQAVIPVGTLVETTDGSVQFTVVASSAISEFDDQQQAYVLPASNSSLTIPVQATVVGAGGNVDAATITVLGDAITYVDSITNLLAFTTGSEAESDAALRDRFIDFIASLARATPAAVSFAVNSTQAGLSHTVIENEDSLGASKDGHFVIVVDDGTGTPPQAVLNSVEAMVELYRPLSVSFEVVAPTQVPLSITLNIDVDEPAYDGVTVKQQVEEDITAYINGLGVGADLYITKLAQLAYDASAGVLNVTSVLAGGSSSDVIATHKQVVRPTAVTATVL